MMLKPIIILGAETAKQLDNWGCITVARHRNKPAAFYATLINEQVIKTADGDTPHDALANLELALSIS